MSAAAKSWTDLLNIEAGGVFEDLDSSDQVDVACDVFESLWISGENPPVEEFLSQIKTTVKDRIRRELIPLEFEYRVAAGDVPSLHEYFGRFSESGLFVAKFFCDPEINSQLSEPLECIAGKYWLLNEVGAGSSGRVYRGYDDGFHRFVAVKLPITTDDSDSDSIQRFQTEAKNAGSVSADPGIVSVHEVGEHEGRPYIISDFVEGKSLAKHLSQRRQFNLRESAQLVASVAETIDYAHRRNIIHRDLKPGNIMLAEDVANERKNQPSNDAQAQRDYQPKVLDFGLAQRQDGTLKTVFGAVLGTPAFMSPEQATGAASVDARTDVYSLGAILFRLLFGRNCFERDKDDENQVTALLWRIVHEDPKIPKQPDASIPRDLRTICFKCLSKVPADRYTTAAGLADDLRRWLRGEPILARALPTHERMQRWVFANKAIAAAISAVMLLMALAGWVRFDRIREEARNHNDERVKTLVASVLDPAAKEQIRRESMERLRRALQEEQGSQEAVERLYPNMTQAERLTTWTGQFPDTNVEDGNVLNMAIDCAPRELAMLARFIGECTSLDQELLKTQLTAAIESGDTDTILTIATLIAHQNPHADYLDHAQVVESLLSESENKVAAWCQCLLPLAQHLVEPCRAAYEHHEVSRSQTTMVFAHLLRDMPEQLIWAIERADTPDVQEITRTLSPDVVDEIVTDLKAHPPKSWLELYEPHRQDVVLLNKPLVDLRAQRSNLQQQIDAWYEKEQANAAAASPTSIDTDTTNSEADGNELAKLVEEQEQVQERIDEVARLVAPRQQKFDENVSTAEQELQRYVNLVLAALSMRVTSTTDMIAHDHPMLDPIRSHVDPRGSTTFSQRCSNFFSADQAMMLIDQWGQSKDDADLLFCLVRGLQLPEFGDAISEKRVLIQQQLMELYRSHDDAGVHAACAFTLRRAFNAHKEVDLLNLELAEVGMQPDRDWYHTPFGCFMILIRKGTHLAGDYRLNAENQFEGAAVPIEIPFDFGIAAMELTENEYEWLYADEGQTVEVSDQPHAPQGFVQLFASTRSAKETRSIIDCARRVNRKCGYDEFGCFQAEGPNEAAVCNLSASGFRLPTYREWKVSCAAGSQTPLAFGSRRTPKEGVRPNASQDRCPPVSQYMPNRIGFSCAYTGLWDVSISPVPSVFSENELLRKPVLSKIAFLKRSRDITRINIRLLGGHHMSTSPEIAFAAVSNLNASSAVNRNNPPYGVRLLQCFPNGVGLTLPSKN